VLEMLTLAAIRAGGARLGAELGGDGWLQEVTDLLLDVSVCVRVCACMCVGVCSKWVPWVHCSVPRCSVYLSTWLMWHEARLAHPTSTGREQPPAGSVVVAARA